MTAKLIVVEGKSPGAVLALGEKPLVELGSGPTVDLNVDDPEVAGVHLKLHRDGDDFTAFDLSGRGFLVNDRRALKALLQDGDVLKIGATALRFDRQSLNPTRPIAKPTERHEAPPASWLDEAAPIEEPLPAPSGVANTAAATPAPPVARPILHATRGNDAGKKYDLAARETFVLGRGVATDITIWDIRASRIHCRIDRDEDGLLVTDLNSSNGTYVNGRKIETVRLRPGDEIKIGATVLKLE